MRNEMALLSIGCGSGKREKLHSQVPDFAVFRGKFGFQLSDLFRAAASIPSPFSRKHTFTTTPLIGYYLESARMSVPIPRLHLSRLLAGALSLLRTYSSAQPLAYCRLAIVYLSLLAISPAHASGDERNWEKEQQFWSFQSPKRHPLPQVSTKSWPAQPIDHFILARLEQSKLAPSGPA